jgi:hypothetical protein
VPGEADLNVYAYVSGRPLQATDPLGLDGWEFIKGLGAGALNEAKERAAGFANAQEHAAKAAVAASEGRWADAAASAAQQLKQNAVGPVTAAKGMVEGVAAVPKQIVTAVTATGDEKAGKLAAKPIITIMETTAAVAGAGGVARGLKGAARARSSPGPAKPAGPAAPPAEVRVGCFVAGTLVWTSTGLKAIELVQAGDWVLSRNDGGGGSNTWRQVLRTLPKAPSKVVTLQLSAQTGESEGVGVTPNHPLFEWRRGWVAAGDLRPDDYVWSLQRGWLRVVAIRFHSQRRRVYNLEVDEDHTYAVGQLATWAHNECPGAPKSVDPAGPPLPDPAPPSYKSGHPSRPVVDHVQNRARGGHPTDPVNLDVKTWEANSRKAGFEGNYTKDLREYQRQGLSRQEAEYVLRGEQEYIVNDVHARPVSPHALDKLPNQ